MISCVFTLSVVIMNHYLNSNDLNLYFHLQVDGEQLPMEPEVCGQIVWSWFSKSVNTLSVFNDSTEKTEHHLFHLYSLPVLNEYI